MQVGQRERVRAPAVRAARGRQAGDRLPARAARGAGGRAAARRRGDRPRYRRGAARAGRAARRGGVPGRARGGARSRAAGRVRRASPGSLPVLARADPGDAVREHVGAAAGAHPQARGGGDRGHAGAPAGALPARARATTSRAPAMPRTPRRRSRTPSAPASRRPRCSRTRRRPSTTRARSTCRGASSPRRPSRRCELLLRARRGPGPRRRACARVLGVPRGGRAGRAARRRRGAGARRDRGVAPIRAAARRGRHRADRDDRARARARSPSGRWCGCACSHACAAAIYYSPDRDRMPALSEEAMEIADRARRPGGARVRVRGAAPGAVGRAPPGRADRGLDRDAHAGAPDRQPRAPASGACLARSRPARARRPGCGRRPDRGVRGRRGSAAPAAVRVELDPVAGDAGAAGGGAVARGQAGRGGARRGSARRGRHRVPVLRDPGARRSGATRGRMGELEQAARQLVEENPDRPAWRAALATLLCEEGRLDEAREEFARLAAERFRGHPEGPRLDDRDDAAERRVRGPGGRRARRAPVREARAVRAT